MFLMMPKCCEIKFCHSFVNIPAFYVNTKNSNCPGTIPTKGPHKKTIKDTKQNSLFAMPCTTNNFNPSYNLYSRWYLIKGWKKVYRQDIDKANDSMNQNIAAALPTTKHHDIHSKTNTYTHNNYSWAPQLGPVSYTHLTLPTICSV